MTMTMVPIVGILLSLAADPVLPVVVKQEIVVTAAREEQPRDRVAAAVTVLDSADLERLPAASLAEVLAFVPGVTMFFDGGAGGVPVVTSRGFFGGGEVEYVKLLVDGVPVGDAESGNADWQSIRAADIDRLEVVHGPGSALYGDTALGGVIQVFTRTQTDTSSSDVRLGAGSFGAAELHASHHSALGRGLRMDLAAGKWLTDGFRENAAADGWLGRLTLERLGDRSRWRFDAGGDRQGRRQPGALTRGEIAADRTQSNALFDFDRQTTTRGRAAAAFDSFGAVPLRATLYGIHREDDNLRTLLLAPGFGTSAFRSLTTNVGGGTFEASRDWTHGVLRAGADLERARLSARYASVGDAGAVGGTVATEKGTRDRVGLFVTGGWTPGERWQLTAGMRRDDVRDAMATKRHASAWSPRAGLNVHLGPAASPVSLFVQLSRAFKAPTVDQLFDLRPYPDGTGGTFTISNPELRPQRAHDLEAGLSRATASSDWSVVAYRMNVRDEIDFDPQTFTYRNIGSSEHRGIEARLGFAKTSRISPTVTYAWTRVADSATPYRQLKNIPEHAGQLLLHARLSAKTSANAVYRWRSAFTLDDEGAFRTPSSSRVDLRLAREIGKVRLDADVLNALDAHGNELGYVLLGFDGRPSPLEFPAPGRALRLGLTWSFR